MNDIEKQQRFVFLRAEGLSFDRIAADLEICKPTCIKWSRKFQFEIQNQRAILREHLEQKWLSSLDAHINSLGEQLHKLEAELAKRDVSSLTTGQLFTLTELLRRQIKRELGPMKFISPVSDIPHEEYVDEVQEWKP